MTILKFTPDVVISDLVFCIIDKTDSAVNNYAKEIVKNQADYTISNIVKKGYEVYQGYDEDLLLKEAVLNYNYAVVLSTGTEFIKGNEFFDEIKHLKNSNIALAGHILDRKEKYYELHHQCYFINLKFYKELNCPVIGQELNELHTQTIPLRSIENFHDNYTPLWISPSAVEETFNYKCHGWNIISIFLKNNLSIVSFTNKIKDCKIYLYPETIEDFNKQMSWINFRQTFCLNSFVHTQNTDVDTELPDVDLYQILTPASGLNYLENKKSIKKIVFYDYNLTALDYWRKNKSNDNSIVYDFVNLDLLGNEVFVEKIIDLRNAGNTLINISNIFCYEGTSCFANLSYRIFKENELIKNIKSVAPEAYIKITVRASHGFEKINRTTPIVLKAKDFPLTDKSLLMLPTWHQTESI
jgi:hypothetical protein